MRKDFFGGGVYVYLGSCLKVSLSFSLAPKLKLGSEGKIFEEKFIGIPLVPKLELGNEGAPAWEREEVLLSTQRRSRELRQ